jgi:hypothetical protein
MSHPFAPRPRVLKSSQSLDNDPPVIANQTGDSPVWLVPAACSERVRVMPQVRYCSPPHRQILL